MLWMVKFPHWKFGVYIGRVTLDFNSKTLQTAPSIFPFVWVLLYVFCFVCLIFSVFLCICLFLVFKWLTFCVFSLLFSMFFFILSPLFDNIIERFQWCAAAMRWSVVLCVGGSIHYQKKNSFQETPFLLAEEESVSYGHPKFALHAIREIKLYQQFSPWCSTLDGIQRLTFTKIYNTKFVGILLPIAFQHYKTHVGFASYNWWQARQSMNKVEWALWKRIEKKFYPAFDTCIKANVQQWNQICAGKWLWYPWIPWSNW